MQRILVVEDDELVRAAVARMLRGHFQVVTAPNGSEALARIERGETFAAIVTDVEMPVMDGRTLVERLALRNPSLVDRVLVMTGGPRDPALAAWVEALSPERVLPKPLVAARLLRALDALLWGWG